MYIIKKYGNINNYATYSGLFVNIKFNSYFDICNCA